MPKDLKDFKIEFAPGSFDSFEGTQEELDKFIDDLKRMVTSEDFFKNAKPVTDEDFDDLPPEVQESILNDLNLIENETNRQRKLN